MRSIWRTWNDRLGAGLARDVALVCLADGVVGLSFGAIAVSEGLPVWLPMLLSVVVFAGAAQFMFIGLVASGGNPVAAVVAALLVNLRHVPFGFAIADLVGRGWRRMVGTHLMIDESVAFALAQRDPARRRAAYWVCGIALFVCWNVGVVAGAFAGTALSDTDMLGLDAAFPAVLLALVLPSLRTKEVRLAVLLGAVVAVAATPVLPTGLPVLLSLVGVVFVIVGRAGGSRPPSTQPDPAARPDPEAAS